MKASPEDQGRMLAVIAFICMIAIVRFDMTTGWFPLAALILIGLVAYALVE